MRVVVDTNVLVSGLLSPFGPPAQIVRMITSGTLAPCYDGRLLSEYREVVLRPRFPFPEESVDALLHQIVQGGDSVVAEPLPKPLPDRDDEPFLEVAWSGGAEVLITGNLKHYPVRWRLGITVLSPGEFLEHYRKRAERSRWIADEAGGCT